MQHQRFAFLWNALSAFILVALISCATAFAKDRSETVWPTQGWQTSTPEQQGMSSAALQVQGLQHLLAERVAQSQGLQGLAQSFFSKAADIIFTPWTLASLQDLAYPQTQGERPAYLAEEGQYFAAVDALTAEDVEVHRQMVEVLQMMKPLSALREESLRSRVLEQLRKQASA